MNTLVNRHILLGVTGGIAAYKSAELVRALRQQGAELRVVMTEAASAFITPLTLQALSGHPVRTTLMDPQAEAGMGHIELARWADLVLVAPASADFMARLTAGMANDLLSTLCLATQAPIAMAPAMNVQMWQAAVTQENAERLRARAVQLWGPAEGEQACGEVGPGRMLEPQDLAQRCADFFSHGPLRGVKVLVTAGPTREAIDPVRYISNRSSGKMGYAVAQAAASAGAEVVLVSGPVNLPCPRGVERIAVESAEQMLAAVMAQRCDIFIASAAVADYRPAEAAQSKIKKSQDAMSLNLRRNLDILATVSGQSEPPFTVGFAAETDNLKEYALGKLAAKNLDMIAANWVGEAAGGGGFESDSNALTVFWPGGEKNLPSMDKQTLAQELITIIAERFSQHR